MPDTDWRLDISVQVTNGDWRTRGEAELQISAHQDVIGTIDVTNAAKKLVAQAITNLKIKTAERAREQAESKALETLTVTPPTQ